MLVPTLGDCWCSKFEFMGIPPSVPTAQPPPFRQGRLGEWCVKLEFKGIPQSSLRLTAPWLLRRAALQSNATSPLGKGATGEQ